MTTVGQNEVRVLGDFILDESARTLTRQGEVVPLTPKEFDTLVFLVEAHGKAVEKDELVRAVWKDIFVGDNSLARNISVLRRYLGAHAIQTLPKFGYRFALPVAQPSSELLAGGATALSELVEPAENTPKAELTLLPNPADLRKQLRSKVLIAAMVPLVLLGGAAVLAPRLPKRAIQNTPKIAVLPLRNHSTDPEETNYLRDGFADEVTDRLCQVSFERLRVLARASSGQYTDTSKAPKQIAEELGAQYLLDGTIEVDRSQVRLSVQLIDGPDQIILFGDEANIPGADAEYRRALALNPDDARAHHWYALLLAAERLYPASLAEATTGFQLDPRSTGSIYNYGFMLIEAGQASNGVHVLQDLLKREPQNDVAWGYLGAGYAAMRQYGRSADAFLQASKFSAVKVEYRASYAYALAMDGQKDKARAVVLELEHQYSSGTWVPGQSMTTAYIALGDKEKQLLWLKRGLIDRSIGPFEANAEPIHSAALSDPRLMKEIGKLIEAN